MTIHLKQVKNRHQQFVPLSPALKEVLLDYLKTWEWKSSDFLFPTYEGKSLKVRSFQCAIERYNKGRGVSKTSVHLFRHTFAKNYILGAKVDAYPLYAGQLTKADGSILPSTFASNFSFGIYFRCHPRFLLLNYAAKR